MSGGPHISGCPIVDRVLVCVNMIIVVTVMLQYKELKGLNIECFRNRDWYISSEIHH